MRRYARASATVRSTPGATWYDSTGFYADAQAQVSWYRSQLDSAVLGELVDDNHGSGEAFSLELGERASLGGGLSVTPQIQMAYSNVRFDGFVDPNGAAVSSDRADSLKSCWGISVDHQQVWDGANGGRQSHLGVFTAYVSARGHAFIDRALYLPKSWTCFASALPSIRAAMRSQP